VSAHWLCAQTGGIRGTVVNESSEPVADASVAVILADRPIQGVARSVRTDRAGRFVFGALEMGPYVVFADKESDGYPQAIGRFYDIAIPTVEISGASPMAEMQVRIGPKAATLVVSITDAVTGEPLQAQDKPAFRIWRWTEDQNVFSGGLNPEGKILIPAGREVGLEISADGYETWHDRGPDSQPAPLNLPSGASVALDIKLRPLSALVTPSFELVKRDLTVNEPVFLKFTVTNHLEAEITLDLSYNFHGYGSFRGTIVRPDGTNDSGPKPSADEMASLHRPRLAPGESYSMDLLLNRWFDFDVPGQYTLEIETVRPFVMGEGAKYGSVKRQVTIDIGPRDAERLRRLCQGLQEKADASAGWQRLESLELLTNIRDPIAVPYMAYLFSDEERFAGEAQLIIGALQRIGDHATIERLVSHRGH
jgi:hypothetical protein